MKSNFKKFTNICIFILSFLLICPIYNSYASNNAYYEPKNSQQFAITSANEKWLSFNLEYQSLLEKEGKISKTKYFELVKKYDGAMVTYSAINPYGLRANVGDGFSEAFVNGGVNDYAYSRSGIENLRTYYGECENAVIIGTGAAVLHGPIGAVLGAIGAGILVPRLQKAQDYMKDWFNVRANKGGVRITASDCFPINSLYAQNQAIIK